MGLIQFLLHFCTGNRYLDIEVLSSKENVTVTLNGQLVYRDFYHKLLIYFCKSLYCETTNYFTSHVDIKNFTNLRVLKIIYLCFNKNHNLLEMYIYV